MAGIPPGFNSDELVPDEDESVLNPYFNIGQKKISEMLAFAVEDRITSKRRVKNLQDSSGAPGQARQRQLWFNYFRTFIVDILGQSIEVTPTGELICRFIAHIIERLQTKILGKPAYSKGSLKTGIYNLTKRLTFQYPDFKLTSHAVSRIQTLIESLANEGKIFTGKWRESQWVGFLTLRSMMKAYINDGLLNGVNSWDIRISRWLSIVLQSSADSRAGEIVQTHGYKGKEFMAWEDIEIKLVGGSGFEHLQAQGTILWEKGSKNDPSTYRRVRWRPLEHSDNTIIDPIVLLLIHALRNGQVDALTIEGILQQMAATPSRTLIWTNPSWPIIPAIARSRACLDFPNPASTHQLHKSLLEAGRLGGIIRDLWLHDIRRGCARDNKNIKNIDAGMDPRVAASLGHSMAAFNHGVTAIYAERESMFIPNAKEKELCKDTFGGPKTSDVPYKPQRITSHLINQAAKIHPPGLSRWQLANHIQKEQKQKWEEEANIQRITAVSQKRRYTKEAESSRAIVVPQTVSQKRRYTKEAGSSRVIAEDINDSNIADDTLTDPDENEAYHFLDAIRGVTTASHNSPLTITRDNQTDMVDELFIEALIDHGDKQEESDPLQLSVLEFIKYFASINTVRRTSRPCSPEFLATLGHTTGNSRNPLEQFTKSCIYQKQGCSFRSYSLYLIDRHELTSCIYRENVSPEAFSKHQATRPWQCSHQGCGKTFLHQENLLRHERLSHSDSSLNSGSHWEPRTCDRGCTSSHVFTTQQRYRDHVTTMHPIKTSYLSQKCALKDICGQEKEFQYASRYRQHLRRVHKLDVEGIRPYMPAKESMNTGCYERQPCPLGNCSRSEKIITRRKNLVDHLTSKVHSLSEREARLIAGYVGEED